jgi:hypothetical protein
MAKLIEFDQENRKIHLDPIVVARVVPHARCPGWSIITLLNGTDYAVKGDVSVVAALINRER